MARASRKPASSARRKKPAAAASKATANTGARAGRARAPSLRLVGADASTTDPAVSRHMRRLGRELAAIVLGFAGLIALLALASFHPADPGWSHTGRHAGVANLTGHAGAWFADLALYLFGYMAWLVPGVMLVTAWALFRDRQVRRSSRSPAAGLRLLGAMLMLVSASGLADLHVGVGAGALPDGTFAGGILGTLTAWRLVAWLHPIGTTLLLLAVFFCSLTLAFGTSWLHLIERIGAAVLIGGRRVVTALDRAAQLALGWLDREADTPSAPSGGRRRSRSTRQVVPDELAPVEDDDDASSPWRARTRDLEPLETPGLAALLHRWCAPLRRRRDMSGEADPLLDKDHGDGAVPSTGLAAAVAMARQRFGEAPAVAPRGRVARRTVTGKGGAGVDALGHPRGRIDDAAARLGSISDPGPDVPSDRADSLAPTTDEPPAAVPATSAAARKRAIEIKPRICEQKQSKLFLDVPDSDLPPISLLDAPEPQQPGFSREELEALSRLLEEKLAEFRIVVEVVAVHPGPVITRFEVQPAPGIKASRITNLSQDIARSMSLPSVRVVEVIPGRPTVGIEVPNDRREIVQLSEMLQSSAYVDKKSPLTLALGKDISGQPVTADLARMPHLLVAGTTGSGKSVAVNSMLISLLYKATAKDVRLILIDPKMLELNVYDDIPHLLAPVVTDMKEAANALRWCVGEMERRYTVMAELKVRNLAGYNRKIAEAEAAGEPLVDPLYRAELSLEPTAPPPTLEPMPMIVVVVDEFADMMMQVGKKAEEMIARIAQKARAAGIHLILATQRPSVDVITGLIKANVPTRIAFQVSQKVDSRTILDQGGAESLLGHGDMLYLPPGKPLPERVHGAFVDDHEVHAVVAHLKTTGAPNYIEEILQESTAPVPGLSGGSEESDGEQDPLYDQAVHVVCESRKASISYVQRRLKIGYNRAARIIEVMEETGVVSTVSASGTREVLAPPPI